LNRAVTDFEWAVNGFALAIGACPMLETGRNRRRRMVSVGV